MMILLISAVLGLGGLAGLAWSAGGSRMVAALGAGLVTTVAVTVGGALALAAVIHPTEQEPVGVAAMAAFVGLVAGVSVGVAVYVQSDRTRVRR